MEILYLSGMVAVFVLCLALLSTARRILRSSPMSNAEFGTTRMYEFEPAEEESLDEISSTRMMIQDLEVTQVESVAAVVEPVTIQSVATEIVVAEKIISEPVVAASRSLAKSDSTEESVDPEQTRASKWGHFPKPTRQTYNYALECLLIGISAWVLVKTQRETLRHRAAVPTASRDRVA